MSFPKPLYSVIAFCLCVMVHDVAAQEEVQGQLILAHDETRSTHGATIAGIVTDSVSGEVLIGSTVLLQEEVDDTAAATTPRGTAANKFGFYSIPNVAPGSYRLHVRSIGYHPLEVPCKVAMNSSSLRLDLKLIQDNIRLQEVVVEGRTLTQQPVQLSAIEVSRDIIEHMPSLGGEIDVFRSLQLLPGVKAASEISSGLYIRGGSPDQNLVLLDGVVLYNPTHLGGFLSAFDSDALNNIRLIKGAFPAEYGGRLSSVVDLTMKEGTKERIHGSGGISLISSHLMLEGPITDNSSFMISGRRMYLDLLYPLFAGESKDVPVYYFYDLNTKLNVGLSEHDRLFASGYFGRDVLTPPRRDNTEDFDIGWGNSTANLRWMHIHTPSLFTTFSLIYTNYDFSSAISRDQSGTPSNFESTSRIRDYLVRSEAQWFPDEHHAVKAGAELTRHNLLVSASDVGDVPLGRFLNQSNLVSVEGAAYVQDEWKISALLTGNLGARLSYFSDGKYLFVEPRVSAAYALSDSWRLKGSFSVSHQFLHLIVRNDVSLPTDLWFSSTPSILPGESLQSVFGVESSFLDGRYLFTIEAYYKSLRHLYEYRDNARFSFGSPLEEQFTSGNGEAYGIEVFLSKRVGAFTGWIGYTLAWTKETFPDLNEGRTFYPRYDRRHDISAVLTYTLGEHWEFGATWTYGTGQAYTFPTGQYSFPPLIEGNPPLSTTPGFSFSSYDYSQRNGYRLPPFHKLDLNFVHKYTWFGLPFQFSINVYNAYNRRNPFAQEFSGIRNGVPTVHQFTLFPIIPSFGLSVKF